ncbi:MAG: hypothetical protein EBT09_07545 [Actinobacteria bacterium]|nr:hypothetical protein [Actinomycetota bacterium]
MRAALTRSNQGVKVNGAFWREPTVVDINRLPMRQHLGASATVEAARRGRVVRRISLDGRWKFRLFKSGSSVYSSHLTT